MYSRIYAQGQCDCRKPRKLGFELSLINVGRALDINYDVPENELITSVLFNKTTAKAVGLAFILLGMVILWIGSR